MCIHHRRFAPPPWLGGIGGGRFFSFAGSPSTKCVRRRRRRGDARELEPRASRTDNSVFTVRIVFENITAFSRAEYAAPFLLPNGRAPFETRNKNV